MKYIDIHSHLIYGVDDGSKTLEQSLRYLLEIKKIGLKDIVCTPHVKFGTKEKQRLISKHFDILVKYAKILGINLYMGNEILWSDSTLEKLENKKLKTLNNTKYILLEFKRNENISINSIVSILDEFNENGYNVILAHPELYINYRNISDMHKIKDTKALLQIDATSLYGKSKIRKFTKKMLKERLVDIIATDSHCNHKRNYKIFKKAYKKIKRKYGYDYANILFYENPLKIIGGKNEKNK